MTFYPRLTIGDIVSNKDIVDEFKCGNMGGMRRSLVKNALVLISDNTKKLYHDEWIDEILMYTGMGQTGDQSLENSQNRTLNHSNETGTDVYLFEVEVKTQYTYRGQVKLYDKPFQENQKDKDGIDRKVWIFPLCLVNDVHNPLDFSEPPVTYDSWEIISSSVAIKHCDLSFFQNRGTAIPKKILSFWEIDKEKVIDNVFIMIDFVDKQYKAHFQKEKGINERIRLFWGADLAAAFENAYPGYKTSPRSQFPAVRFEKCNENKYRLDFIIDNINAELNDNSDLVSVCETDSPDGQYEGKRTVYYTTRYERDGKNRKDAIKIHGAKCMACDFDFLKIYGETGAGFVEVHHIKPLHSLDEEVIVDPKMDLVCLCSNCHRMVHRKKHRVLELDELKMIIKECSTGFN